MTALDIDFAAIKDRQQRTWASGDYAAVAARIQPIAEQLVATADLAAGTRVLDVACGSGNAALAAARCGCDVTGVDYVEPLLVRARERAFAEGFDITFGFGDAEALPYADASFDSGISCLGVMFAPDQERAADELARVVRPGGTIALANWTPTSFVGDIFRTVAAHVPPPAGLRPPGVWGTETRLRELFDATADTVALELHDYVFRFESAQHLAGFFRECYGPVHKAFEVLDEDGRARLYRDLVALAERHDCAAGPTLAIRSQYQVAVLRRR